MKKLFAILGLLTLASCATVKAPSIKEIHLAKQKAARAHAVAQLYSPTCPAPAYYDQSKCGLENETFTADLQKFSLESCQGLNGAACEAKFAEKVIPRWQARYPRARVAEIADWCASHAKACHNLSLQELRWMDSHNQTVLAELDVAMNDLKKETRMAYEEQRRQLGVGPAITMQVSTAQASASAAKPNPNNPSSLAPAPAAVR